MERKASEGKRKERKGCGICILETLKRMRRKTILTGQMMWANGNGPSSFTLHPSQASFKENSKKPIFVFLTSILFLDSLVSVLQQHAEIQLVKLLETHLLQSRSGSLALSPAVVVFNLQMIVVVVFMVLVGVVVGVLFWELLLLWWRGEEKLGGLRFQRRSWALFAMAIAV